MYECLLQVEEQLELVTVLQHKFNMIAKSYFINRISQGNMEPYVEAVTVVVVARTDSQKAVEMPRDFSSSAASFV